MGGKEEIELAIELAITKLDLRHTGEVALVKQEITALRGEIPEVVAKKIKECQLHQERRRKWNASTGIAILAVLISLGSLVATNWHG